MSGILNKDDYKTLKASYSNDGKRLGAALQELEKELDECMNNTSKRVQWIEYFRQFENISEIDRSTVIQLIMSIHIYDKKHLQITFNYKDEYEQAVAALEAYKEAKYIRLSVEDSNGKGNSIENQKLIYFTEKHIRFIAVTDNFDTENPDKNAGMMLHLKNIINEAYAMDTRHDEKEPCYNLRVSEKELHKVLFDIISKQAEIILNINDITELDNLQLKTEQTVELEKQIENCRKEKQHLYEQLLTRKITLDEYQMLKENCDADMRDYELQYDRSCCELEQTKNDNQTREKFIQIAKDVKKENTLTQALADMLVDKVLVYPDKRIDVIWKIQDFCRDIDMTEMS